MKAIVQDGYGSVDALRLTEVDKPPIAAGEVLVRVRAASVHADVWHVVSGFPYVLRLMGSGLRRPKNPIPGTDMAGVVEAVGANVTRFAPGDAVFGETHEKWQWVNGGTFAEYVAAPENVLARKPDNVSFEEAACVPTSGIIALFNMKQVGPPKPGQKVLVNGAGGGVGTLAVQIAKAFGAHVTAVDRADKLDMLRSLGADAVIDYEKQDFTKGSERYDIVFDVASNLHLGQCTPVLTKAGKYLMIGHDHYGTQGRRIFGSIPRMFGLLALTPFSKHLPELNFEMPNKQELMEELRELIATGKLTPVVEKAYPLGDASQAIRSLSEGQLRGKLVLTP